MDYEQRQQEVKRVESVLRREWDGTPVLLARYMGDQPEDLRRDTYALYWRLGTTAAVPDKRSAFVEFMLQQTVAETPMLRGQLLKWLQDFRREDFGPAARETLMTLPWTPDFAPEVIRLIGIAELRELLPRLRAQVEAQPLGAPPPPGYHGGNTWAALLALARMGDEASLASVMKRTREESDIVLQATVLTMDLAYTRQPRAFDLLRHYLNSHDRLPQVKETDPGRLVAAYVAAAFSKYVRGFPIDETDFTEPQVMQARAWVNAQSHWQFK